MELGRNGVGEIACARHVHEAIPADPVDPNAVTTPPRPAHSRPRSATKEISAAQSPLAARPSRRSPDGATRPQAERQLGRHAELTPELRVVGIVRSGRLERFDAGSQPCETAPSLIAA
jgi:hypothetical protein